MATLKQRLHKKNAAGNYDIIHLETSADLVLMTDGTTKLSDKIASMDTTIAGKLASTGTAAKATKLATARTVRTNLASTATASFDGSANITPGVTGILPVANGGTGVASLGELKKALGLDNAVMNGISTSNGTIVDWSGYTWIVVHVDADYVYMILNIIKETTAFGSNNTYAGSTLASKCAAFLNTINSADQAKLAAITVNGVTSKVFVPSYEQVNGAFSWFSTNNNRIVQNTSGAAVPWWTSSPSNVSGELYWVGAAGNLATGNGFGKPNYTYGFRPCVAYKRWG